MNDRTSNNVPARAFLVTGILAGVLLAALCSVGFLTSGSDADGPLSGVVEHRAEAEAVMAELRR